MKEGIKLIVISVCMLMNTGILYAESGGAHVEWSTKEITGIVLAPDGETAIHELPIRIWNADTKKMIFRSKTDIDGRFTVPALEAGNCFVFIGRIKIEMKVLRQRTASLHQSHDMIIVLPRPIIITASPSIFDVILAPVIMKPPEAPRTVSP